MRSIRENSSLRKTARVQRSWYIHKLQNMEESRRCLEMEGSSATVMMERPVCATSEGRCERRQSNRRLADCQVWIGVGDIVLIGLRDFQDDKADIIMKYTTDEARQLKAYGEIPENGKYTVLLSFLVTIDNTDLNDVNEDENCAFEFDQI